MTPLEVMLCRMVLLSLPLWCAACELPSYGPAAGLATPMPDGFIRFAIASDMFADTVDTAIPNGGLTKSDAALTSWATGDGGAIHCRATS